jgi:hypothetical protein
VIAAEARKAPKTQGLRAAQHERPPRAATAAADRLDTTRGADQGRVKASPAFDFFQKAAEV